MVEIYLIFFYDGEFNLMSMFIFFNSVQFILVLKYNRLFIVFINHKICWDNILYWNAFSLVILQVYNYIMLKNNLYEIVFNENLIINHW